jgi:DNA-binding PadR family transcriptional regulator
MYRDNSLIPSEALRLCALGRLMLGERHYAELAGEVRHFTSRMVGPSLELLGTSIELLRLEGLVDAVNGKRMEDNPLLRITDAGRAAFRELMRSHVRSPGSDVGKLTLALKMRFLDLLSPDDKHDQIELMADIFRQERARLLDLRQHVAGLADGHLPDGHLAEWLDLDIEQIDRRVAWLEAFQAKT